ncbi:MAG TPA: AAA family ATPase, partial [Bacillota bacterium]|nr:AAA family ATPase [Bacillota bacterium]
TVKITDFSASAPVLGDSLPQKPVSWEGTAAYMSPEQTGRLNWPVDYRSDFYSLGVIFYELLTGKLPFQATGYSHWVHAHLAEKPQAPHKLNRAIPPALSNVILKLLAKDASERYQDAAALETDLNRCFTEWQDSGKIQAFAPAEKDISAIFQLSPRLYGRDKEAAALKRIYNQINKGKAGVVLVSGYAGSGKTALVYEFLKPLVRHGKGYFVSGKSDQLHYGKPYLSFIQAFQELLQVILAEDQGKLLQWRRILLQTLGTGAAVLAPLLPEIELITGPLTPVEELPPAETKNRFLLVIKSFIQAFTRQGYPLVIFLDDLQWADEASLELLTNLAFCPENRFLLLIGAYRSHELTEDHPLAAAIAEMKHRKVILQEVSLAELNLAQTVQMVADSLHVTANQGKPLAQALHRHTGGNPLFLRQLLQSLYAQKLIYFTYHDWRWEWNLEAILKQPYSDDLLSFLVGKLQKLAPETQKVLKWAACHGDRFQPDLLATTVECPAAQVEEYLRQAQRENLILRQKDGSYLFLHDRIRQAAYGLISPEQKKEMHLQLGRLLDASTTQDHLETRIIDMARHLNLGVELITDPAERLQLAQFNLMAGRKVKATAAYRSALYYLRSGLELLPDHPWEKYFDLTRELTIEMAQCEYMCGNHDIALHMMDTALEQGGSSRQRAEQHLLKTIFFTGLNRHREAMATGLAGLKELGIAFPDRPGKLSVLQRLFWARWRLRLKNLNKVAALPEQADPLQIVAMDLLIALSASAYYLDPMLCASSILKMVEIALKHPNVKHTPVAVGSYAVVASLVFGTSKNIYRLGQAALNLAEKYDYPSVRGRYVYAFTFLMNHWVAPRKTNLDYLDRVLQDALAVGDLFYAGNALFGAVETKLLAGYPLDDVIADCHQHIQWLQALNLEETRAFVEAVKHLAENLKEQQSRPPDFTSFMAGNKATRQLDFYCRHYQGQYLYYTGQYQAALNIFAKAESDLDSIFGLMVYQEHCFFHALCISAYWPELAAGERRRCWKTLRKNLSRFRKWARHGPENFGHRLLLLKAEAARLRGRKTEALELYEQAVITAAQNNNPRDEALANLLAAEFYLYRKMEKTASAFLADACRCFEVWGASAITTQLKEKYSRFLHYSNPTDEKAIQESTAAFNYNKSLPGPPVKAESFSSFPDLASLLRSSWAQESNWREMAERLICLLMENTGAQKGGLIMYRGEELYLEMAKIRAGGRFTGLAPSPLKNNRNFSAAIVQYVAHTGNRLVLDDAAREGAFGRDPYVAENNVRSVCCLPLSGGGRLAGLLYLENNLIAGAFSREQGEMLQLLGNQAAFLYRLSCLPAEDPTRQSSNYPPKKQTLPEALTCREAEVLNMLAGGLSNREIAERLRLTENTVKSHIKSIYGKLGVNRRLQAVTRARKMELLGHPPEDL